MQLFHGWYYWSQQNFSWLLPATKSNYLTIISRSTLSHLPYLHSPDPHSLSSFSSPFFPFVTHSSFLSFSLFHLFTLYTHMLLGIFLWNKFCYTRESKFHCAVHCVTQHNHNFVVLHIYCTADSSFHRVTKPVAQ